MRRARWELRSRPLKDALLCALWSGGSPTCQVPVPAESTKTSSSSPSRRRMFSKTPWANGERQMFPMQTNRTLTMRLDFREPHGVFQAVLQTFSVEPCLSGTDGGPGEVRELA